MSFPDPSKALDDVEKINDRLATEHPIDDYYERSPWVIRRIQQHRLDTIRRMVACRPGMRILEVGSGGGHVLRMFREAKLTALDVSDVYLDTARRNLAGYDVSFLKGELPRLGLPPASFDCVVCTEVLEHTVRPDEVLGAIRRVLASDGKAVITVPVDPLIDRLKAIVRRTPIGWVLRDRINWGGDQYHLHKWWPHEFERLLARDFVAIERSAAPSALLPLHACFSCRPRAER
jgi:SAM-dependent methyltransferase